MATASASETSSGDGTSSKPRSSVTICCTCAFSARPVANDGALDLGRRVLRNRDAGLSRREHQHTAYVPELRRAARVLGVEEVLDGQRLGLVGCQQIGEPAMERDKLLGKGRATRRRKRAAHDDPVSAAVRLDAAVSGALGTGVNPEDSHASEASISFASISKLDQTCRTSS